ncbi:MAG: PHP domain-containing protein [Clostridia bacterium]|jgi:putative hydrolase|nr:PHP domain-containing protein [Clostridia bacterium]MBT7123335.1 PHP domain-containing protein [Clostridia bacterium]
MRFEVDTHTHTVLSGHAQSTLLENAAAASEIGLKGIVLSDHGPSIQSAPPDFNISTFAYFPKYIHGVKIYYGCEVNITDYSGSLDIRDKYLQMLDYAIAGLHSFVITSGGRAKDTDAVMGAINNKYIDVIAHPDNPSYDIDYEVFVKEVARLGKLIELNEHSLDYRDGAAENAVLCLDLCKKHDVRIAVSSDAHISLNVGVCNSATKMLEANNFPSELIVNLTQERFDSYIASRAK